MICVEKYLDMRSKKANHAKAWDAKPRVYSVMRMTAGLLQTAMEGP
ncbi:hypothetical protein PM3016_6599 [Paenibacillus mucilaginosus 3016]|uniref:Uncharacterized protein n=2 Tax=Paenibacillus mucilaginosus TaxID=61624 RepID=H6NKS7_9BACL|nr:hypothetical protein PM3016_6599 [Paenibacillus mucilaginosus 3016]AFH65530.1 hypothetical protein B2K_33340 [Paenibacillus mucilaginosus K02]